VKRRCGFLGIAASETAPVWAHRNVVCMSCPKTFVSAQSLTWLDEFRYWQRLGGSGYLDAEAKKMDAFLLIEAELAAQKTER
jgi:hypothetical protein